MNQKPKTKLLVLFLLPAILHIGAFSFCVIKYGSIEFTTYDLVFYLFFTGYPLLTFSFAQNHKKIANMTLLVYSLIIAVIGMDIIVRQFIPAQKFATPWIPMHRISYASDAMPGIEGEIEFSVNRYGLRGPDVDLEQSEIKILAIGGSTTECLYVTDKKSWPWLLQDKLNSLLNKKVFVGNAGRSGHFTLNHQYLLENYKLTDKFDWAVFLVGINDMGRLLRGDYQKQVEKIAENTLQGKYAYKSSPYYDRLMMNIISSYSKVSTSKNEILQDPEGMYYKEMRQRRQNALKNETITQPPAHINDFLQAYKINLEILIDICEKKGIKPLFLTQPTMYRKNLPENLETLLWQHTDKNTAHSTELLAQLIYRINKSLIEVCNKRNIPYIDAATMLEKDLTVFYDDCHFNTSGSVKMANILYQYFKKNL